MNKDKLIQSVPLFSDLNMPSVKKITERMVARTYNKEQMILVEESLGETFFILSEGSVKITRMSDDGREVILAILGEGDFFGEMALLDGEGRSANVVALADTQVLTLQRSDFLDILEQFPKIAIHLLKELTTRIRYSDQQIESLSLSGAEQRIAMVLLRLAEEMGQIKEGTVTIENIPFQQDVANMAGTSRETVSRVYKMLEEKNYIIRKGKTLIIKEFTIFSRQFT
ncbi:MAG: Crp/Fnr family transcriptional regulator [Candidatus Marinimicrobia bacterium]|nr:Crp/Fnr family transcriptional regulator [Candidatus Neomarinimicrobiota bacterium]|tara:strand:+ start:18891 stop:19571 length:681 start_codon:yes stop_codon:yes gene_type:complete